MIKDSPRHLQVELQRGQLALQINQSDWATDALIGFAERRNPKRAFLFVSKVLGRHIPVAPARMREAFSALAALIPDDLPGPVLVLGMAETAVGLAAGVHQVYAQHRDDSVFLTTTRHPLGTPLLGIFEESHSHASRHLIHLPQDPAVLERLMHARSLVLVDDEASTGNTFANLVEALEAAGVCQLERIVAATLTDWSDGLAASKLGPRATSVALLEGAWRWLPREGVPAPDMPQVGTVAQGSWAPRIDADWGRLGICTHSDSFAPQVSAQPGERILVLGSSEFVWPPFLLAERLAAQGADVRFSATTRSPISLGHAIDSALAFNDNYGLNIPNFVYNVDPSRFDRILLCVETAPESVDPALLAALSLEVISYGE